MRSLVLDLEYRATFPAAPGDDLSRPGIDTDLDVRAVFAERALDLFRGHFYSSVFPCSMVTIFVMNSSCEMGTPFLLRSQRFRSFHAL